MYEASVDLPRTPSVHWGIISSSFFFFWQHDSSCFNQNRKQKLEDNCIVFYVQDDEIPWITCGSFVVVLWALLVVEITQMLRGKRVKTGCLHSYWSMTETLVGGSRFTFSNWFMHERQNTLEGLGSCIFKYFLKRAKGVNHAFNDKKLKKAELMGMMKWLYLFFCSCFFSFPLNLQWWHQQTKTEELGLEILTAGGFSIMYVGRWVMHFPMDVTPAPCVLAMTLSFDS